MRIRRCFRRCFLGWALAAAAAYGQAPSEHKEIKMDPKAFDKFVGTYQLAPSVILTASRDGDHFYTQLTGQDKIEIFPENDRNFFLKVVDAQLTFDIDGQGTVTQVTLHQNGQNIAAKRIGEDEAKAAADALAKRVKDQTQSPGTEAALRGMIESIQSGEPKYEIMSPQTADAIRQQLPQLKPLIAGFGALQSIKFTGVGPAGADIYEVKFGSTTVEFRIMLENGKVTTFFMRPI